MCKYPSGMFRRIVPTEVDLLTALQDFRISESPVCWSRIITI